MTGLSLISAAGMGQRTANTVASALLGILFTVTAFGPAKSQELAIDPRFDAAGLFHEGIAPVKSDGRWGFIDKGGDYVVEPQYDGILGGSDGRFGILKAGRWGYITTGGNVAIAPGFEAARPFREGVAAVKGNGLWGYILPDGRYLRKPTFSQAGDVDSGFSLVVKDGRCHILFRSGEQSDEHDPQCPLPRNADQTGGLEVQENSEGRAILRIGDLRYYVRECMQEHTQVDRCYGSTTYGGFRIARPYSEGLAAVRHGSGRWGYIDEGGTPVIDFTFDGAREFKSGVAPAAVRGKWGYIDRQGRFLLKPQYDRAYSFSEGYAIIRHGDKRGFLEMDQAGRIQVYVEPRFDDVYQFSEGFAPVKIGDRWGYLAARRQPVKKSVRGITEITP